MMLKLESFVNSARTFWCARCLRGKPCESDYYEATSKNGVDRWCKLCGDLYDEGCVDTKAAGLDMMRQRVPVLDAKRKTGGGLTADEWGEYLYSKKQIREADGVDESGRPQLDQAAISEALGSTMAPGPPVSFGGMGASTVAQEAASKADKPKAVVDENGEEDLVWTERPTQRVQAVTVAALIKAAIRLKVPCPGIPDRINALIRESRRWDAVLAAMPAVIDWGDHFHDPPEAATKCFEVADAVIAEAGKRNAPKLVKGWADHMARCSCCRQQVHYGTECMRHGPDTFCLWCGDYLVKRHIYGEPESVPAEADKRAGGKESDDGGE